LRPEHPYRSFESKDTSAEAAEEAGPSVRESAESEKTEEEEEDEEDGEGGSAAKRIPPKPLRTGGTSEPIPERSKVDDLRVDSVLRLFEEMNRLMAVDSRAALIRLASYIEFAVLTLAARALPGHNVRTFNEATRTRSPPTAIRRGWGQLLGACDAGGYG
jgi:hypothetical protein